MSKKILYHITGWGLLFCYFAVEGWGVVGGNNVRDNLIITVDRTLNLALPFYLNYWICVPQLLIKRNKFLLYILSVGLLLFIAISYYLLSGLIVYYVFDWYEFYKGAVDFCFSLNISEFLAESAMTFRFILISTGIRLGKQYYHNRLERLELEELLNQSELSSLKNQVNSHFLYNGFNSIYALSLYEPSKTPTAVLQLLNIMKYVDQSSNKFEVPIHEELRFINDYIEFQKLRMPNPELKMVIDVIPPKKEYMVPPLILLTFIENAFKHSSLTHMKSPIKVSFKPFENGFYYQVSNEISLKKKKPQGSGLKNFRRLMKLTYPTDHELVLEEVDGVYTSSLKIRRRYPDKFRIKQNRYL